MQRLASHVLDIPDTTSPTPAKLVAICVLRRARQISVLSRRGGYPKACEASPAGGTDVDRSAAVGGVSAIITLTLQPSGTPWHGADLRLFGGRCLPTLANRGVDLHLGRKDDERLDLTLVRSGNTGPGSLRRMNKESIVTWSLGVVRL